MLLRRYGVSTRAVRTATAPAIETIAKVAAQRWLSLSEERSNALAHRHSMLDDPRVDTGCETGERRDRDDLAQLASERVEIAEELFARFAGGQMACDILHFMRFEFAVFEGPE